MANNAENILVPVTGSVHFVTKASIATITAATTPEEIETMAPSIGYLSDGGWTLTIDEETTDIRAWQGNDLAKSLSGAKTVSVNFEALEENNTTVHELYWGGAASSGITQLDSNGNPERSMVIVYIDSTQDEDKVKYLLAPRAKRTSRGEKTFVSTDATKTALTFNCLKPAVGGEVAIVEHTPAP